MNHLKQNLVPLLIVVAIIFQVSINIHGQYLYLGKCINYPTKFNFSITNFTGTWYLIEKYLRPLDAASFCTTFQFTTDPALTSSYGNGSFRIWSGRITPAGVVEQLEIATRPNVSQAAKYVVNPEGYPGLVDEPLWILATDYRNWTLAWSCRRKSVFNFQTVFFLSRTQVASRYSRDKVYSNMRKLGLNTRIMKKVPQQFC